MAYVADAQQILTEEKKEQAGDFARSMLRNVENIKRAMSKIKKEYEINKARYLTDLKIYEDILALSDVNLEEATYQYYNEGKTFQQILEMLTPPKEED